MMLLTQKNIETISKVTAAPSYDRSKIKHGIVHVGVGGFHRSHQAYYIHKLLEKGIGNDWGICGIGLREADRKMYDILKSQDFLYSLITRHPNGLIENEIIGSITDMLLSVDSPGAVIEKMAHEDTKIVSLTITEGGYNFDSSGEFNFLTPDVVNDLNKDTSPKTVFGYIAAALKKRKSSGLHPFSVMSCDNIQHNGDVAKKMILSFIEKYDEELYTWVKDKIAFPNTMVDRITPVTTLDDINYLKNNYSYDDLWPVSCEPFIQWVIEDHFKLGRPKLENLGVQFVADVKPYEKMKLRLLNAGHSVLGIPGAIHGHPTINACMEDEVFSKFMRSFMDKEATPTLDPVEGVDLSSYKDTLEERFSNPNIKDSVARICSESSAKLPKFLLETLEENLKKGGEIKRVTLVIAAWCYYSDFQKDFSGNPLEIVDAMKSELHQVASETNKDSLSFLKLKSLFGELIQNAQFTDIYKTYLSELYQSKDIRSMMKKLI